MQFSETVQQNIRGVDITRDGERAFHCILSFDTHEEIADPKTEAVGLLYAKALLSGCKGYSREAFLDAINLLGASINVSIDSGILTIAMTSTDTNMPKLLKLFEAMLTTPAFAEKEIKRIKGLLQNELHEEKEDAKAQSLHLLVNSMYGARDRRHMGETDALINDVAKVSRKDLISFHKKATENNWIFTFISDTKYKEMLRKKLLKLRSSFATKEKKRVPQHILPLKKTKLELLSIPSKQNIEINIGGVLPLYAQEKDYYAFLFGLNVLGKWGGFAGRLMSTVREKEGLTYGIYARIESSGVSEYGYWRIMTFFAPEKVLQGLTSTMRECSAIREKGITPSEYARFKTIISTSEALLRDSIIRTASDIHGSQVRGFDLKSLQAHRKNMLNVTIKEVNAALKKYLDPDRLVITGAGPIESKKKELKALISLAKNRK